MLTHSRLGCWSEKAQASNTGHVPKHQRLALGAKRGKIHSTSVYTTQCLISAAKLKFHRGSFSLPFNFHSYRVAVSHSFIL
jgi:hypothetical protein